MISKKKILVTGAGGQLGMSLREAAKSIHDLDFYFYSSKELNITSKSSIENIMDSHTFDFCINCAAYTDVDGAESQEEEALNINYWGVKNLVDCFKLVDTVLIQLSTDYVFDGENKEPYTEKDATNPINVYGVSKLKAEQYIQENLKPYYVVRTSWLYSSHGRNFYTFVKDMLEKNHEMHIINTQFGSPTNAYDLADALVHIIRNDKKKYGIYHFSNKGVTNWYIFAKTIIELLDSTKLALLFARKDIKRKAKRPIRSGLAVLKFENEFNYIIPHWLESLKKMTDIE